MEQWSLKKKKKDRHTWKKKVKKEKKVTRKFEHDICINIG